MIRPTAKAAVLIAVLIAFTPIASAAAPQEVDLTNTFRAAGAIADRLQVYEIAGVVLIRGRVADKAQAEDVGRIAQSLGYTRVANLIQVIEHRMECRPLATEVEAACRVRASGDQFPRQRGIIKAEDRRGECIDLEPRHQGIAPGF